MIQNLIQMIIYIGCLPIFVTYSTIDFFTSAKDILKNLLRKKYKKRVTAPSKGFK